MDFKGKKILITGGTGTLGKALVKRILDMLILIYLKLLDILDILIN